MTTPAPTFDASEFATAVLGDAAIAAALGNYADVGRPGSKSVIPPKYRALYKPHNDTCGDAWVQTMFVWLHPDGTNLSIPQFERLARDNGIDPSRWMHLKTKSGSPNVGMWRMNLGNCLRAMHRKGTAVVVGDDRYEPAAH